MTTILVDETVSLPKEAKAVKDLILGIVQKLHDKASIPEIVAGELVALEQAIAGLGELSDDVKSPQIAVLAGLLGGQVAAILLSPSAAPAAPQA